ncbi:L-histidine N(alpha)-methyltransferase [Leucothrix arctica]|uniref:L-histidine N(Alpha)-methyltransferase n=1 Tax=Leucothrix arctica TaxID=1481894 RepID=A0A317C791_9GAMM|nr:L-histidine N(alpha)-methyltransferase [Leucothrix arctica]PWQ94504.1 L-histidine N(alpha)-methyltransferase [Leucothrix arctica]
MNSQFAADVDAGLSKSSKTLPSKYFYDKKGDELFMQIMALPEYYLTRAELEIFTEQTPLLIDALGMNKSQHFELIEMGAGDGSKTKFLLKGLLDQGYDFDYLPIDISGNVLEHLVETLQPELLSLSIKAQQGDYFEILKTLKDSHAPKVVLFLGSNIGNQSDEQAAAFMYSLGENLAPGDRVVLGADLIKPVDVVLPAYNDSQGVTKAFNLNLLTRINRELSGDFDVSQFEHAPEYTEEEGIAKSFIQSKVDQTVTIGAIGQTYSFKAGEKVHVEISRKYNKKVLAGILKDTDFNLVNTLKDSKAYYGDFILERSASES